MKIDFMHLNDSLEYNEVEEIVCSYDDEKKCKLGFQVTGGLKDDIELRVCFDGDETFELEDDSTNVAVIKLYDIVRAAACWERGSFLQNNKSNAMKAIASYLRHTANILELEAIDVEKNHIKDHH